MSSVIVSERLDYLKNHVECVVSRTPAGRDITRYVATDSYLSTSDEIAVLLKVQPNATVVRLRNLMISWGFDPKEWEITVEYTSGIGGIRKRQMLVVPRTLAMAVLARSSNAYALGLCSVFDTTSALIDNGISTLHENFAEMVDAYREVQRSHPEEFNEIVAFAK